jgi:hypothetical protein
MIIQVSYRKRKKVQQKILKNVRPLAVKIANYKEAEMFQLKKNDDKNYLNK